MSLKQTEYTASKINDVVIPVRENFTVFYLPLLICLVHLEQAKLPALICLA